MSILDRNVIDITFVEDNKYILIITDHLEWNYDDSVEHAHLLQDKIYDYLDYIYSGQAEEKNPGLRPVIRIISKYSYSNYSISFLEKFKKHIKETDDICDLEWEHDTKDGPFNDGFNDEYVFDSTKLYPRIKKNWAKNPLENISILNTNKQVPDQLNNLVLFKSWDSFIDFIMVDIGEGFDYFSYDMMPADMTPEQLRDIAFENLINKIKYKYCEIKEPGIFLISADGNFEAESIYLTGIWEQVANQLGDDIIISIPTKDVVLYTKLNDEKLRDRMLNIARETFDNNKESLDIIFCKDIFIYLKDKKEMVISDKYSLK